MEDQEKNQDIFYQSEWISHPGGAFSYPIELARIYDYCIGVTVIVGASTTTHTEIGIRTKGKEVIKNMSGAFFSPGFVNKFKNKFIDINEKAAGNIFDIYIDDSVATDYLFIFKLSQSPNPNKIWKYDYNLFSSIPAGAVYQRKIDVLSTVNLITGIHAHLYAGSALLTEITIRDIVKRYLSDFNLTGFPLMTDHSAKERFAEIFIPETELYLEVLHTNLVAVDLVLTWKYE